MSAYDRFWPQASATLTANGGSNGIVSVTSTTGFYSLQEIVLTATGVSPLEGEVKEVLSATQMRIGARNKQPNGPGQDLSAYTTGAGAQIIAPFQRKFAVDGNVFDYVYESAPTVALRTLQVDPQGNYVTPGTVSLTGTVIVSVTTSNVVFQYARTAAASITAGNSSAGTALTIMTLSGATKIVAILNSLNQDVSLTYNGTEVSRFESGDGGLSFDLDTNGLQWASGAVIGIFHNGTAPSTGSIRITAQR